MQATDKTLLRFTTTGSVDDGKSTLIGRLLYETKSVFEDQYAAIEKSSIKKGFKEADLSYLLDGLSAEREQGITIDVAYRYFETPRRKFIITDTPGHVQYTRNMVTGASKADCAIILIDARNGVLTQSKRHGFLVSLLQIQHLIVAVNKMDLVDYSQEVFEAIVRDYEEFSSKLDIHDVTYIPVSALKGDNVTMKSERMPWYEGTTLLHCLESIHVSSDRNLVDFRFPVQYVLRPDLNFRGFAGTIASGTICPGEEVVVLPSGKKTKIKAITTYDGELKEAFSPQSVVLTLEHEIDISRGDMLARIHNVPRTEKSLEVTLCWMDEKPLDRSLSYILKHTTRTVKACVKNILYKIDVDTLHRLPAELFALNDIGRVEIELSGPIFFDPYKINRETGSFILIDPVSNNTVAAGMLRDGASLQEKPVGVDVLKNRKSSNPPVIHKPVLNVSRSEWERMNGHKAFVLWFTGISGSGKSTLARALEQKLFARNCHTVLLDGDNLRLGLCSDLGFGAEDRKENIRRAGEIAKLFFEQGNIVICTFISPFTADRAFVRSLFPEGCFMEIHVHCSVEEGKRRDPKGLYQKAERGSLSDFTGISSPYEPPQNPEIRIETEALSVENGVALVMKTLLKAGMI